MVYLWSTGENIQSVIVAPVYTETYYVTVSDVNGCSAIDDVVVTTKPLPYLDLIYEPNKDLLTVSAIPSTYPFYSFYIDSQLVQSGESSTYTPSEFINNQTIYVTALENGCTSLIEFKSIPNAFTPKNNDGVNDVFLKGLNLRIINRWGQQIYEGVYGWDGKYKGEYVSKGTYFYLIKFTDKDGVSKELKGSVSVIN